MRVDGEMLFFAGLFVLSCVVAICVTIGFAHYRDTTVEYAKAGLQECVAVGMSSTVWQRDCK